MNGVRDLRERAAADRGTVLILGEPRVGNGKALCARSITRLSWRTGALVAAARHEVVHRSCGRVVVLIDRGAAPVAHASSLIGRSRANLAGLAELLVKREPAHRRYALFLVAAGASARA